MDADWVETRAIMQEVELLFQHEDDVRGKFLYIIYLPLALSVHLIMFTERLDADIQDIKRVIAQIEQQQATMLMDAKEIMKRKSPAPSYNNKSLMHLILSEYTSAVAKKESEILAPSEVYLALSY